VQNREYRVLFGYGVVLAVLLVQAR
jgi:hypothetical protein